MIYDRIGQRYAQTRQADPRITAALALPAVASVLDVGAAMRGGMSAFALADQTAVAAGVARLAADLTSGPWEQRYGHLRHESSFDAGYRLLRVTP